MYLKNLRFGHATNSSSSHSIVIMRPGHVEKEKNNNISSDGDFSYGWEWFRLASREEKLKYIATHFFLNLIEEGLSDEVANDFVKEWFGYDIGSVGGPCIDHQSREGAFSYSFDDMKNDEVRSKIIEFFEREDVLILGGNDNDDLPEDGNEWFEGYTNHYRIDKNENGVKFCGEYFSSCKNQIFREDIDHITFFDRYCGTKIRLGEKDKVIEKSSNPELVDVKITDYCPYGCEFCYQSSTKNGVHAPLSEIKKIVDNLAEMQVFEIAIGGGEPTMHPDFVEILEYTRSKGVIPNFTTFSVAWLKNDKILKAVMDNVGGIGVSVHNDKDINKVLKIKEAIKNNQTVLKPVSKVVAQHVVGSVNVNETLGIFQDCIDNNIHLLLLGYKDVGFGENYTKEIFSDLPVMLKIAIDNNSRKYIQLSIDTALYNNMEEIINVLNVSKMLVTPREGAFSCYIDAVTSKMGASSYVKPESMQKLPTTANGIKELFATY